MRNKTDGGEGTSSTAIAKFDNGEIRAVSTKQFKENTCSGVRKGIFTAFDSDGAHFEITIDDPRYKSGELKGLRSGYVIATNPSTKHTQALKTTDPRYISGEYVSVSKNKVTVYDHHGNKFRIELDDPRYISGEFTVAKKKTQTVFNKEGERITLKMGEYDKKLHSHHNSGKRVMKDKDGNIVRNSDATDLVGVTKGRTTCKDVLTGNKMMVTNEVFANTDTLVGINSKITKTLHENKLIIEYTKNRIKRKFVIDS